MDLQLRGKRALVTGRVCLLARIREKSTGGSGDANEPRDDECAQRSLVEGKWAAETKGGHGAV